MLRAKTIPSIVWAPSRLYKGEERLIRRSSEYATIVMIVIKPIVTKVIIAEFIFR